LSLLADALVLLHLVNIFYTEGDLVILQHFNCGNHKPYFCPSESDFIANFTKTRNVSVRAVMLSKVKVLYATIKALHKKHPALRIADGVFLLFIRLA